MLNKFFLLLSVAALLLSVGCTGSRTFPMTARAGDTITLGLGYDALEERKLMDRSNTVVTIEKNDFTYTATSPSDFSLRAVLQLYPDPRSKIANYSGFWLETPALRGDPYETVVVFDLPTDIPEGNYTLTISSPHIVGIFPMNLEVIPGVGASNDFKDYLQVVRDITDLEPAPSATISLDAGHTVGALSMVVDFDELNVSPTDINVQIPRYVFGQGKFQDTQRMLHWSDDGSQLTVNIVCPNGVTSDRLNFDILYPEGSPDPAFTIVSQQVYDIDGNEIAGVGATLSLN